MGGRRGKKDVTRLRIGGDMTHRNWIRAAAVLLASFGMAGAQTTSTRTITGPNGKTASRTTTRNGGSVQSTVTGPNGKSATRSTTRGGGSVQSTVTGPNGQTARRSVTRGGGSATATVTGPKGKTATRQRVFTRP
ncbi:MAG TPA: hypothetical protein VG672_21740 [Bryobacteraceae bacterium]|nr:hypothetical protein [Bryobacteraceae bacterium]